MGVTSTPRPKKKARKRIPPYITPLVSFLACVAFGAWFLFGSAGYDFNQFWPDIVGTFIGVFGAVSLQETIQTYRSVRNANRNLESVAEEVMSLASDFAHRTAYPIANPRLKSLLSSEESKYLDPEEMSQLAILDQAVDYRNRWMERIDDQIARTEQQPTRLYDYVHIHDEHTFEFCMVIIEDYHLTPERDSKLDQLSDLSKSMR